MKRRIEKKIYKRAETKLLSYRKNTGDNRTFLKIAKSASILTPLERKVFITRQTRYIDITNEILNELENEERAT